MPVAGAKSSAAGNCCCGNCCCANVTTNPIEIVLDAPNCSNLDGLTYCLGIVSLDGEGDDVCLKWTSDPDVAVNPDAEVACDPAEPDPGPMVIQLHMRCRTKSGNPAGPGEETHYVLEVVGGSGTCVWESSAAGTTESCDPLLIEFGDLGLPGDIPVPPTTCECFTTCAGPVTATGTTTSPC